MLAERTRCTGIFNIFHEDYVKNETLTRSDSEVRTIINSQHFQITCFSGF